MIKILFLCTGNYYRSRFAEEYFNHFVRKRHISYEAFSRALLQDLSVTDNVGNIAEETVRALKAIGVQVRGLNRQPLSLKEHDLMNADIIVALDKTEHQPMIEQLFPVYSQAITYFSIEDVDRVPASKALPALIVLLDKLLDDLSSGKIIINGYG